MSHLSRILILASLVTAGCGEDAPPADVDCTLPGRYMALTPGATWSYEVDDGDVTQKDQTVGALEDVGGAKAGTMAYRLTTTKANGTTVSWQEDTGEGIVRHREQDSSGANTTDEIYQPFRTRIDESEAHSTDGATWTEGYTEIVTDAANVTTMADKEETWTVEATEEAVTVPAGSFCAMRVRRVSTIDGAAGSDKLFWFARGVGKVKETGANQTEVLVSYSVD